MNRVLALSFFMLLSILGLVSCKGSGNSVKSQKESTVSVGTANKTNVVWVSAFSQEMLNVNDKISVIATDTLRKLVIKRLRKNEIKLNKIFSFSPSLQGEVAISRDGRNIDFTPNQKKIKPKVKYTCNLSISELTGIEGLEDLSFNFIIKESASSLRDLTVKIDPNNSNYAIVIGSLDFSAPLSEEVDLEKCFKVNTDGVKINVSKTSGQHRRFTISNIKRDLKKSKLKIEFFSGIALGSKAQIDIPGLQDFMVMSADMVEQDNPYIVVEFSKHLDENQDLDGLITIDEIDNVRLERHGASVYVYYKKNGLSKMALEVSDLVKSADGDNLLESFIWRIEQPIIAPKVEILAKGTILPDGANLTLPFKAINLAAVDVEIVKIYTNNVLHYIKEYEISNYKHLRKYGRVIYKRRVNLCKNSPVEINKWRDYSIDLKNLFNSEPGAIYNVKIYFRKDYSLVGTTTEINLPDIDLPLDSDEWNSNEGYISRNAPDYNWMEYSWQESEDPSKASYYMNEDLMPEINVISSNLGLIVKSGGNGNIYGWVTDMVTTAPLQGVKVVAYNHQLQKIGQGVTGEAGGVELKIDGEPFILTASKGGVTTYLKYNRENKLSYNTFNISGESVINGIKGFIYGERGVWRPGDDIYLTLMVEDKDNVLPVNHPVTFELYNPDGNVYYSEVLKRGVDGIYTVKVKTDESVITGNWRAKFIVGSSSFSKVVPIETIKPNRLKIDIKADELLISGDDNNNIALNVQWLAGNIASGLDFSVEADISTIVEPFKDYSGYLFNNPFHSFESGEYNISSGSLDDNGEAIIEEGILLTGDAPGLLRANLIVTVQEEGGDESITSKVVNYSMYNSYVGIYLGTNKDFIIGKKYSIPVVAVTPKGEPVNDKVEYYVYRCDKSWWNEITESDINSFVKNNNAIKYSEGEVDVINGKGEIPLDLKGAKYGQYFIYVKSTNGEHATGSYIYVDEEFWMDKGGRDLEQESATLLSFGMDKERYSVGEYANITIPRLYNGKVLLSIERGDKVVKYIWVDASSTSETVSKILVTKDMAPNFYLSAILLQPYKQTVNSLPIRLYGLKGAEVVDNGSLLNPIINAPDEIMPQQEFVVKIGEKNRKPFSYTLAIVDEGLLNITSFKTPAPWRAMNKRLRLNVETWDMYKDVIGAYAGKLNPILKVGGDEALRKSYGTEKRFNPVVKFLGPFTYNGEEKSHKIKLPMYVGSVRVMVVAAKNGSYGSADKDIAVKAPVMFIPTLPRVLNCGDKLKMPINLFTDEKVKKVDISVTTEGPLKIIGSNNLRVDCSANHNQFLDIDLEAGSNKGKAAVLITATGNDYSAKQRIVIDIQEYAKDKIITTSEFLKKGEKREVVWNSNEVRDIKLTLSSIASLDKVINKLYLFARDYSFVCTEQLSSIALTMLYLKDYLSVEYKAEIDEKLPFILKMITSRQLRNGGFPLWPGDTKEDKWVTSMVLEVIEVAKNRGYSIANDTYNKLLNYQNSASKLYVHDTKQLNDLDQAYRLYTLALCGAPRVAQMNKLREARSISKQALLRLAATYSLVGKVDVANKLLERADKVNEIRGSYHNYWSALRDKAMELQTWALIGNLEKVFNIGKDIAEELKNRSYFVTQDVGFISIAVGSLTDLVKSENLSLSVEENGKKGVVYNNFKGLTDIKIDKHSQGVVLENLGDATLYITTNKIVKNTEKSGDAVSNGIGMNIRYVDANHKTISVDSIKQGTTFYAIVDVQNKGDYINSMALSFIIPSGWEIYNNRLTSLEDDSRNKKQAQYDYLDFRDDRVNFFFKANNNESKRFYIQLRAAYKGSYVMPNVVCEDMYNPGCYAQSSFGAITKVY